MPINDFELELELCKRQLLPQLDGIGAELETLQKKILSTLKTSWKNHVLPVKIGWYWCRVGNIVEEGEINHIDVFKRFFLQMCQKVSAKAQNYAVTMQEQCNHYARRIYHISVSKIWPLNNNHGKIFGDSKTY